MTPEQPDQDDDSMHTQTPSSIRSPVAPGQRTSPPEIIPAGFLFKNTQEVLIRHKGDLYHLRITRNDKLILTK